MERGGLLGSSRHTHPAHPDLLGNAHVQRLHSRVALAHSNLSLGHLSGLSFHLVLPQLQFPRHEGVGGRGGDLKKSWSVSVAEQSLLLLSLWKHFSEPCDPSDSAEQGQLHDRGLAEAMAENLGVMCRRASQEDMGLDDTASQQSISGEQ